MIFTVIFVLFLSGFSNSINVNVSVDTTKPIRTVSDKFLSVTLDISLLMYEWKILNFTHITPLISALGPGYLRFGGTHADYTMFYENPSTNTSFEGGKVVFS
uniref:Uncharacterized protein n=1 Tax=Acrobeloides nanus TaxID=290746 RepID=A0A914DGW2_9BILA